MRHLTKFFGEPPILLAVLIMGFLLRVSGILWGISLLDPLEGNYHPDEWATIWGAVGFPGHILTNTYLVYPTFFPYFLGAITFPVRFLFD